MPGTAIDVNVLLDRYPAPVKELAGALRTTIRSVMPDAQEMVDVPAKLIGYGYSTAYSDLICVIVLSKTGVKLGLARGVGLPDPRGLLEGTGKAHRYVILEKPADLRKPGLKPLLRAAVAAWRKRKER